MRVLFIYSNHATYIPPHYQHGIGYLSAALKQAGYETGLIVYDRPMERDRLLGRIKLFAPDMVAFSAASNQYKYAREHSGWIREELAVPMVVGGVHATLDPEGVIEHAAWDYMVRGEGEEALLELVETLEADRDPARIANVWMRRGEVVIRNEPRPLITDLDSLPFPDREIFDDEHLLRGKSGMMSIMAGRGCPYGCAYCSNPAMMRLYKGKGKWVRQRGAKNLLEEIQKLADAYSIKLLYFDDDVFTLDREWMMDFLDRYRRRFDLPFRVNVRVETVDREMLAALKDAGCEMIQVGVEHGDESFRRKILRRHMSDIEIENVFKWANELELKAWSFNMLGFPGETLDLVQATIELNERLRPDHMQVSVFNPYPGTALYRECREKGFISSSGDPPDGYFKLDGRLDLPTISQEQIRRLHRELIELAERIEDERRIELKYAGRKIHYDLIDMLDKAFVVQPVDGYVKVEYFSIDDDMRKTLLEHPVSRASYRLKIPAGARLEFALGIHPEVWSRAKGDGVVFQIEVTERKLIGRVSPRTVFSHHLDTKRRREHRRWFDFILDLHEFAGKTVDLTLITAMHNDSESDFNTAGWANPLIVEAPKK